MIANAGGVDAALARLGLACVGMKIPRALRKAVTRKPAPVAAALPEPDDAALFREAIGPVRVIDTEAPAVEAPKPQPNTRRHDEDEAEALRETMRQPLDALAYAMGEVLEFQGTEFVLLALGVVMTVVALVVGVFLYRAGVREHREQMERERRERDAKAREAGDREAGDREAGDREAGEPVE